MLSEKGEVKVAMINADKEKKISQKEKISAIPALRFYLNGNKHKIIPNKPEKVMKQLERAHLPAFQELSEAELSEQKGNDYWIVFRGDKESEMYKQFLK